MIEVIVGVLGLILFLGWIFWQCEKEVLGTGKRD
jgi:hypothetical protein